MNSFETIAKLLKETFQMRYFKVTDFLRMVSNEDLSGRVHGALYYWVTDPTQNPDSILQLLDTYLTGLDGFCYRRDFQNLVAFYCLEALAKRRPVLVGSWEKVVYIIAKYSKHFSNSQCPKLANAKRIGEEMMKRIQKLCSSELCPNPCLRLELIRLTRLFSPVFGDIDYDRESFRELVINTICEIHDNYSNLRIHKIQMSAYDFMNVIEAYSLDIRSIMHRDHPESKRTKIIGAVVKITGIFALLEKERPINHFSAQDELLKCIHFCGLIPNYDRQLKSQIPFFIEAICDKPILLGYVIDTYSAIKDASHKLGTLYEEDGYPSNYTNELRDLILYMIFKQYVSKLPVHQCLREVYGGFTPAIEYRLRYFYNEHRPNAIEVYNEYENYDTGDSEDIDSESNVSEETDSY